MSNERIYEVLDKISDDVSELKVTSAKQEENLKEHIRRTEIAEENLELIRGEIQPLKEHVIVINGVLKIVGAVSVIVGSIAGIFRMFEIIGIFFK
jgi:BRCT domain type II-containing protein